MVLGSRVVEWIAEHIGLGGAFVTLWIWVRLRRGPALDAVQGDHLPCVAECRSAVPLDHARHNARCDRVADYVACLLVLRLQLRQLQFGNYSATYGSLASVIILLVSIFISAVLLLGAVINADVHHAKAVEPTLKEYGASGA